MTAASHGDAVEAIIREGRVVVFNLLAAIEELEKSEAKDRGGKK